MPSKRLTLYLETTIPSILTARPSQNILQLAHQEMTRQWWEEHAKRYRIFTSQVVLDEAGRGDELAARRRLHFFRTFPLLEVTDEAIELSEVYLARLPLPKTATGDALHLAISVCHRMDYLVTWNCKHLAHGEVRRAAAQLNAALGYVTPTICTPQELS